MLRRVLFVLLTPILAFAGDGESDKLVDKYSGLEVTLPDGWKRRNDMESVNRPLVAVYSVEQGRAVQFVAEVSTSDNYDADAWVEQQKKNLGKLFDKLDNTFSVDERKVGGSDGIGFTLAGSKGEKAVRVRVYHVVRGGRFFQFTEASFADAHTAAGAEVIDGIWEGITFGEATEDIPLQEGAETGATEARPIEDKEGNNKLVMPAGWEIENPPPTEPKAALRTVLVRRDTNGNAVAFFRILRFEAGRAEVFTEMTPGDIVLNHIKSGKGLEFVYGQNSSPHLTPAIDESSGLGDSDAGATWKVSSITMKNKAEIREADTRKRRGEKNVEIPKFKPYLTIGRTALISPYIYHAYAIIMPRASEDEKLKGEVKKILDSFEFLSAKALPPALSIGPIEPGDTTTKPEFAKDRKTEVIHTASGRTVYKLGLKMTIPPGFRMLSKQEFGRIFKDSSAISAIIVAQDESNNWAKITLVHSSMKAAGDANKVLVDKKQIFEGWKSGWESKARGAKFPAKPKSVSWGRTRGKGAKLLEGEVQDWPATFSAFLIEKSGWRTQITVDTQGSNPLRFEKELDQFFKKLKLNYKVK